MSLMFHLNGIVHAQDDNLRLRGDPPYFGCSFQPIHHGHGDLEN
jgi:hypothetical protein